ncbi:hypothetical protein ACO0QE_002795 [Hanseniaspora vineae]
MSRSFASLQDVQRKAHSYLNWCDLKRQLNRVRSQHKPSVLDKMDQSDVRESELEKKVISEALKLQKNQTEKDTIALLKRELDLQKEDVDRLEKENNYLQEYVENLMDSIDLTKNS